jgi:hypothetical protein
MSDAAQISPSPPDSEPPAQIIRVAKSGLTWGLPRSFAPYFVDTSIQGILGNARKFVIRTKNPSDPQFMVKYPQKFGTQETLTEFFINRLGVTLGFDMADSGLVRINGTLVFLTRIFTGSDETLRHGSLVIEDFYKDEKALERVRRKEEQQFYSIDFVVDLLRMFVGEDFCKVFPKFAEMLVFDALIGSMDRHVQNWGVLETLKKPARYRFAPIFDSARALLWNSSEDQVALLAKDAKAFRGHLNRAKPCLGPKKHRSGQDSCNHFDFIANLLESYPDQIRGALAKVPNDVAQKSKRLLRRFPFRSGFSNSRKQLIEAILTERFQRLGNLSEKGARSDF